MSRYNYYKVCFIDEENIPHVVKARVPENIEEHPKALQLIGNEAVFKAQGSWPWAEEIVPNAKPMSPWDYCFELKTGQEIWSYEEGGWDRLKELTSFKNWKVDEVEPNVTDLQALFCVRRKPSQASTAVSYLKTLYGEDNWNRIESIYNAFDTANKKACLAYWYAFKPTKLMTGRAWVGLMERLAKQDTTDSWSTYRQLQDAKCPTSLDPGASGAEPRRAA